jgi:lipopolysaccharide transport system permease protein
VSSSLPFGTRHGSLVRQLIRREITLKFKGSIFGALWVIATPLLTLLMYTLVFSTFMKARWPGADDAVGFALVLFPGLIMYTFFAECIIRAPSLIYSNPNFVKKVVFPLDLLIWVPLGAALFNLSISLLVWGAVTFVLSGTLQWTVLWLPLLLAPFVILIAGLSAILAGLGVYLRDVAQAIPIITQALMFLSPVLYPLENVPDKFLWLVSLNPLTFVVQQAREIMLFGTTPNWSGLIIYWIVSVLILVGGQAFFRALRPGFADVV